ncbi:MAG: hypothetical protein LQ343_002916 [Gyalolechia ehrenbergii]|nr:MAG: hypothetical protein LQ343_002916 [Gyalolechia ehrenbergii]
MSQPPLADVDATTSKTLHAPPLTSRSSSAATKDSSPITSGDNDPQLAGEGDLSERKLAHEAALRRLNGLDSKSKRDKKAPDTGSTASTQPVLVKEYSKSTSSGGMKQQKMRQKRNSSGNKDSSELPPLKSFSFQDILASIEPEIHGSIDQIAEIYGRSRMSLADEYSSHLPPQGDFSLPNLQDHNDQAHAPRLAPVEEASSTHEDPTQDSRSARTRAARLSLVGNPSREPGDLSSNPVISASTVPHVQSAALQEDARRSELHPPYIPQLLAWLRGSQDDPNRSSPVSRRDSGAATALQRVLGSSVQPSPS